MIQDRVECKHCGNRIYPDWRHHGSNMKPCYGGLDSEAEPRDSSSISTEQTPEPLNAYVLMRFINHLCGGSAQGMLAYAKWAKGQSNDR